MIRKLKMCGAVLVAVVAVGAVMASVSSADELKSEFSSVTLTGADEAAVIGILKTTAGSQECTHITYHAAVSTPASTVTITPTYTGCTCLGVACTIDMNGCDYTLHIGVGGATTATVDLVCSGANEVTLTSSKCTLHIPPQTGKTKIEVTNVAGNGGTTRELTLDVELHSLSYSHTQGSGVGRCTSGTATNATLEAKIEVTGEQAGGGAHKGIWVE